MPERTRCDVCKKRRNVTADPVGFDLCSSCVERLDELCSNLEQAVAKFGGIGEGSDA